MSDASNEKERSKSTRVRLSDVAAASGVHYSTVSRVMRPGSKGKISQSVVDRVQKVARELGYRPNRVAASMRTQSTGTVGFVVHDLSDPIYPPILHGIEKQLSPMGFSVLVGNTGYDLDLELEIVGRMASSQIDGIFLATTRLDDPVVERCNELGIPVVSVLRQNREQNIATVTSDCFGGMQKLTRHILELGYRDIAVIKAPQYLSTAQARWQGIKTVLDESDLILDQSRIISVGRMSAEEGERTARLLIKALPQPPEVIICVNDLVAIGAIRACNELGFRIPEDIAVSGCNDIPFMDVISPPLTTVRMDLDEIGKVAGELMLERLNSSDTEPKTVVVNSELIVRNSLSDLRD